MTDTTKPVKLVKLSSLKANLDAEKNGKWIEYPAWPGVAFFVASPLNPDFRAARELAFQDLAKIYPFDPPADKQREALMGCYCDKILKDWRGFDEPLTEELKREVFFDPEYRPVAGAVIECSEQVARVEMAFVEDEAKN